jgi:hypothetical protein
MEALAEAEEDRQLDDRREKLIQMWLNCMSLI